MKIYKFNSLIIKDKMKFHNQIKFDLLKEINKANDLGFKKKDNYFGDDLLKSDWPLADNWERPWASRYRNIFIEQFKYFANTLGYKDVQLSKLWYQQYGLNQTHGWHTHARNYTGTYYLQLPKNAPRTEFLYPDNLEEGFSINVEEGDMLFFPCHFVHRSNKSKSNSIKTIISWNLDFVDILEEHVNRDNNIKVYE